MGPYAREGQTTMPELLTGLTPGVTYLYRLCADLSQPDFSKFCFDSEGGIDGPFDRFKTSPAQGCHATLSPLVALCSSLL